MEFEQPDRRVERVFLHCSASDSASLYGERLLVEVRRWHIQRGFRHVGYHFLIDKRGTILEGRNLEIMPAAQKGHNARTIAIMAHGLERFTEATLGSVKHLCRTINIAYSGRISFHGHCEVSSKSCPVFDYRALLELDVWNRMP